MHTLCLLLKIVKFACCWSTVGLNIALVVLLLHVCFIDVMNSSPSQKNRKKEGMMLLARLVWYLVSGAVCSWLLGGTGC